MKKTDTNFLILLTIFTVSIVIANAVGSRVITTGIHIGTIELCMSGGAITYAFTFLCTDVVSELWGKAKARSMIKFGFIGQAFAVVMIILTGFCPAVDVNIDNAYHTLLGTTYMFVIGSLSAYYVSQSWDVFIFHKIRTKYLKNGTTKARWIWNNCSTITSQAIDTSIYAFISFGIGMGWLWTPGMGKALIGLMIGQYLLKVCLAIIDTPFFYILTRRNEDGETTN